MNDDNPKEQRCEYQRGNFSPLRSTGYGIGCHWTTDTMPRVGPRQPYRKAVESFDVAAFVEQVVDAGAGHVLFTATHSRHYLPGPNPEVDRILPGRTCERDLLMEIADALAQAGICLILYYHHNTDGEHQDPGWQRAVGSLERDQARFYDNYCRIVGWMGEHYGHKATAFWFDAGYGLLRRGAVPWPRMTAAAKAGYPQRLVCYNSGLENHECYTSCQDFWAGEVCRLNYRPRGLLTPAGLPWYSFLDWHPHVQLWPSCGQWIMDALARDRDWSAPPAESIVDYVRSFQLAGGTATINLLCYQDGTVYEPDLAVMSVVKQVLRRIPPALSGHPLMGLRKSSEPAPDRLVKPRVASVASSRTEYAADNPLGERGSIS